MNARDKQLFEQARGLTPVLQVGKNGITTGTLNQLAADFSTKELLKVKLLKSFLDATGKDRKELAAELAALSQSRLIGVVGYVVILYKKHV